MSERHDSGKWDTRSGAYSGNRTLGRNIRDEETASERSGFGFDNGPGKLTKALGIDKSLNEVNMTKPGALFVKDAKNVQIEIMR